MNATMIWCLNTSNDFMITQKKKKREKEDASANYCSAATEKQYAIEVLRIVMPWAHY